MDIYPSSSEFAHWPVTADVDLTEATIEVYLAGDWRAGEWEDAATKDTNADIWHRTARIRVDGPAVTGGAGIQMAATVHNPEYRLTVGGEIIVRPSPEAIIVNA